jgi:hypothetical protein
MCPILNKYTLYEVTDMPTKTYKNLQKLTKKHPQKTYQKPCQPIFIQPKPSNPKFTKTTKTCQGRPALLLIWYHLIFVGKGLNCGLHLFQSVLFLF